MDLFYQGVWTYLNFCFTNVIISLPYDLKDLYIL